MPFLSPRRSFSSRTFMGGAPAAMFLLVACAAVCAPEARAQLLLTITPDSLDAAPGSTVTFSGSLRNNFTARLYLNELTFNNDAAVTGDAGSFFTFAPEFLEANQVYTGNLFNVSLSGGATLGNTYTGSATIRGGSSATEQQLLANRDFNVNAVVTPTPPAGAVFAVLGGLMCGVDGLRRRRAKRLGAE